MNVSLDQTAIEEVNEKWDLPYYARKKTARDNAVNLRRIYQEHQYNGDRHHTSQWDQRMSKSVRQEKGWLAKCKEIGLIEMRGCDPEINAVPPPSATHETIV
eukprot:6251784-Pyramimonas_sp.AAC.1